MRARCANLKHPNYGGRGIRVCERWLGKDGFVNFLSDVGKRRQGKSLDRIDVNGNYEPGNVRWATSSEQNSNRRCSKQNQQPVKKWEAEAETDAY